MLRRIPPFRNIQTAGLAISSLNQTKALQVIIIMIDKVHEEGEVEDGQFKVFKGRSLEKMRYVFEWSEEDIGELDEMCERYRDRNQHMGALTRLMERLRRPPTLQEYLS
jgi:hypothetical protein